MPNTPFQIPAGYKAQYSEGAGPLELQQRMLRSGVGNIVPDNRGAAIAASLQGFNVPGKQITGLTPQQAGMNEDQIRASIAAKKAQPSMQEQAATAKAIDDARFKANYDAYMSSQGNKPVQPVNQDQGILSGLLNWAK